MAARIACWAVFGIGILCQSASASPVVLTFEEFPHRTARIAQYASKGVSFINLPTVLD